MVVDCDVLKKNDPAQYVDGVEAWQMLLDIYDDLTNPVCAPTVRTKSGGLHIYFQYDAAVSRRLVQGLSGSLLHANYPEHHDKKIKIDILADKSFVVCVGSPGYDWLAPADAEKSLPPLPGWLKNILLGLQQPNGGGSRGCTFPVNTTGIGTKRRLPFAPIQATASTGNKRPRLLGNDDGATPSTSRATVPPPAFPHVAAVVHKGAGRQSRATGHRGYIAKSKLRETVAALDNAAALAANRDTWCRVVWAIAETAREHAYDAVDIADNFSRLAPDKYRGVQDVQNMYRQSNGTLSFTHLVELTRTRTHGLERLTRLVRDRMPMPPEKITELRRDEHDGVLVASKENIAILADSATVVSYPDCNHLAYLTDYVDIQNRLERIDPCFNGPSRCYFLDEETFQFVKYNAETGDSESKFELVYPYDSARCFIRLADNKIRTTKKWMDLALRECGLACRTFLSAHVGFSLCTDHLNVKKKRDPTGARDQQPAAPSKSGRAHHQMARALLAVMPLPQLLEKYCFAGHKAGIYRCDDTTHHWRLAPDQLIEKELLELLELHVDDLTEVERRNIAQMNNIRGIRHSLEGYLYDARFLTALDSNRSVFVLDNGLLDFSRDPVRGQWRDIQCDDYVSTSAGWNYSEEDSATYMPAVERFFNELLPKQEEREFVLHYFARLLSGRRTDKQFLVLTDKRAGFNGKTTMMNLLQRVFGSYAITGTKYVCQSTLTADRNSHDAGLQNLKGKRLLTADELKKNMTLDCGWVKAVTGGEYMIDGRIIYSSAMFSFILQAGLVLILNEGEYPKFDASDQAFMARMVVCAMRSKFVERIEDTYLQENTFHVNKGINEDFPNWRSAVLDLLRRYRDPEYNTVPASMHEWKEEICDTNNEYSAWLDEHASSTANNSGQYITAKQIFQCMQQENPNNKSLDVRVIRGCMKIWAQKQNLRYLDRYQPRIDGKKLQLYGVILDAEVVP